MKSRLRSLVFLTVWLLSLFLLITILAVSGLHQSQDVANKAEIAARAIMEIKAAAISTIMLDPALPETLQVFSDAEDTIRLQTDIIRTAQRTAGTNADFRHAMQQWSRYDEASRHLMADTRHSNTEAKADVLALYHSTFKPLEASLDHLSKYLTSEADRAGAVAREQSHMVYWFLFPLLLLICFLVAVLTVVMQRQEARTRAILDTTVEAIMQVDENGNIMEINPACERLFGRHRDELLGASVRSLMPTSFLDQNEAKLLRSLPVSHRGKSSKKSLEVQGLRPDGTTFPAEINVGETQIGGKRVFMSVIKDITDRKRAEQELRIAAITFETHEGILITDAQQRIMRANKAFTAVTGYTAEDVIGQKPSILRSGQHRPEFYAEMNRMLAAHGFWKGEICNRKKNGDLYYGWLTITAVTDDHGIPTHFVGTIADISEHKEAEQEILNMAYYDSLTNLANRRQLHDRLDQSLAASKRDGRHGALLYLDMDKFKTLNDTLGHQYGDMLLCEVARRLQECVRTEDTVARLGGDEFCVMLEHLDMDPQEASAKAIAAAEKIVRALGEPYDLDGHRHDSSASVGVALYCGGNSEDIIKRADAAMYEAKHAGRGTWRLATNTTSA